MAATRRRNRVDLVEEEQEQLLLLTARARESCALVVVGYGSIPVWWSRAMRRCQKEKENVYAVLTICCWQYKKSKSKKQWYMNLLLVRKTIFSSEKIII